MDPVDSLLAWNEWLQHDSSHNQIATYIMYDAVI